MNAWSKVACIESDSNQTITGRSCTAFLENRRVTIDARWRQIFLICSSLRYLEITRTTPEQFASDETWNHLLVCIKALTRHCLVELKTYIGLLRWGSQTKERRSCITPNFHYVSEGDQIAYQMSARGP